MGGEEIMSAKAHGTSEKPVQESLRWKVDRENADKICNFNRHYAEFSGYFTRITDLFNELANDPEMEFYDSVTGALLFDLKNRDVNEFLTESRAHGWPSFRDSDINWEHCRCLQNGEIVSKTGTHLGHNLPDAKGNRYCINLISVAGRPE